MISLYLFIFMILAMFRPIYWIILVIPSFVCTYYISTIFSIFIEVASNIFPFNYINNMFVTCDCYINNKIKSVSFYILIKLLKIFQKHMIQLDHHQKDLKILKDDKNNVISDDEYTAEEEYRNE